MLLFSYGNFLEMYYDLELQYWLDSTALEVDCVPGLFFVMIGWQLSLSYDILSSNVRFQFEAVPVTELQKNFVVIGIVVFAFGQKLRQDDMSFLIAVFYLVYTHLSLYFVPEVSGLDNIHY